MYEGAARVHFIFTGKCKKSEKLHITWLNVVGVIPFITVEKSKMYQQAVKSTASGLTLYYTSLSIHFTFCICN